MPMPSLSTLPQDIHYHLLSSLSSFADLAATVLAARPLHTAFQTHRARVLSSVARNFVGGERLFGDALLLVRCQEKAYGYGYDYGSTLTSGVRGRGAKTKNMSKPKAKTKGLSSGTIRLLMGNARVVGELLEVMWGLVREDKQTEIADSGLGLPVPALPASETETIRFNSAAYRFCVYCLLPTADARSAFLKRYPQIEVLELSHLVGALWVLVSVIRGRPAENERDWDLVSRAISTGPHNVLRLWQMKEDAAFYATNTKAASTFKPSLIYKFKFRKALQEIEADSDYEFGVVARGPGQGGGRVRDSDDAEDRCSEDESDDEDEADLMSQWCALLDAQGFPAELRALDAILDGDHAKLVGALPSLPPSYASGDGSKSDSVPEAAKTNPRGGAHAGGDGNGEEDADSDAVHSDSSVAEGMLRQDRLEDPFDF